MTPQERQRIKDDEKARLRALKAKRQAAAEGRRRASITQALTNMAEMLTREDAHEAMIARLEQTTASDEARIEFALEHMTADVTDSEPAAKDTTSSTVAPPSRELHEGIEKTIGRPR